MGDYLDRMDDLFGYNDTYVMSEEERKKYICYRVDHYYEMRLNNGIEVTERGPEYVYEDKKTHNKYRYTSDGLEQFGTFRFDYFMVTLNPDKEHFKKMIIDRMQREKKKAYNEYRAEAKRIDKYIAEVEAIKV